MTPARELEYHHTYLNIAFEISKLSYAIRSKVGCVIVKDGCIISFGFNGTPSGFDNNCETYDAEKDVLVTKVETLHAESNAIAKLARTAMSSEGASLYVTISPCIECSKLIIQAGIKRVIYGEEYRCKDGLILLQKAGIEAIHLS